MDQTARWEWWFPMFNPLIHGALLCIRHTAPCVAAVLLGGSMCTEHTANVHVVAELHMGGDRMVMPTEGTVVARTHRSQSRG